MKSLLIFISLLFASNAISQKEDSHELFMFGAFGLSGIKDDLSSDHKSLLPGGAIGIGYTYLFTPQWGVTTGTELAFYKVVVVDPDNSSQSVTQQLNFVQIPLLAQFQTRGKNVLYLTGGVKVGFQVYESYPVDVKTVYILSGDAGMKWKLNSDFFLYTGIFGDLGLNKIIDEPENVNSLASVNSNFLLDRKTIGAIGLKVRLSFRLK